MHSLTERIFQIGIFAMCLALFELFFQDMWLSLFGESAGFGERTLGFFVVGIIAFVISQILIHNLKARRGEEE